MPELGKQSRDGRFVFTDLDELDSIIAELEELALDISADDTELRRAINLAAPPASDGMSRLQVSAYRKSLELARLHSGSMLTYVTNQLDELRAARETYAHAEAAAEDRVRDAGRRGR